MSITHYSGTEGPAIDIESVEELHEALDILHTQVMDNLKEDPRLRRILEEAMEKVEMIE